MEDNIRFENETIFDAYLRGELSPSAKQAFEARLGSDAALREEFEFYSAAAEGWHRDRLRREFRQRLDEARRELEPPPPPTTPTTPPRPWGRYLLGAAALLGVFALGWLFGKSQATPPAAPPVEQLPPPPVAQEGSAEDDEPLVGAGSKRFSFKTPLVRVAPAADSLEIVLVEGSALQADLERSVLAIQYPPGQMPDANTMQLLELELAGRKVLYLKMGGKFYPIREGRQGLVEEGDAGVRGWLE